MNQETMNPFERSSAAEWGECMKHEARGALILLYGIKEPTDRQIATYMLYGETPSLRQDMRIKQK